MIPTYIPESQVAKVKVEKQISLTQHVGFAAKSIVMDIKIHGHSASVLIDTSTVGSDLISKHYCHSYKIPSTNYKSPGSLGFAMKASRGSINSSTRLTLTHQATQFKQVWRFEVCFVEKYDVIFEMSFHTDNKAQVVMATDSV